MVLSWKENKKSIPEPELDNIYKQKEKADTLVQVKRKVPDKQECPLKSSGSEDKEFWEDSWGNTELRRRSIELFITDSISLPRVINSRTKPYSSKLSSNKKPKRSTLKTSKPNKKPEDKRTKIEEKEELTNPKDYDDQYLNT